MRATRRRLAAWLAVAATALLTACTIASPATSPPRSSAQDGSSASPSAPAAGLVTAQPNPLCRYPKPPIATVQSRPLPPAIQQVANQVEQVRHLSFVHPVTPEPLTQPQIGALLKRELEQSLPAALVDGENRSWHAMGALPAGSDLRTAILAYAATQVVGFYDTQSHRLVFTGTVSPDPYQRWVLSHELTHALDDQRFNISLIDRLNNTCQDERAEAYSALNEGDAVDTSVAWARHFLTNDELAKLQQEADSFPAPPSTIPPFVENLQLFPYSSGEAFIRALQARGGEAAVNAAFLNPPVSTEQVLHPDKYPNDRPLEVIVPEYSKRLGSGWKLIDQMQAGEGWLRLLLELHLPQAQAETAAAGWAGGEYRAWGDGARTAVLLETVWDTASDAGEFARAVRSFIPKAAVTATVQEIGLRVNVLFGSNQATLTLLQHAVSSGS